MDAQSPDIIESWFRTAGAQGLGLAFTAAFLSLFLWVAVVLVRRLPQLIDTMIYNNNLLVEMAERDRRDLRALVSSQTHIINGAHVLMQKHGERLGIGSDVLVHIDNAKKEMDIRSEVERGWRRNRGQRPQTNGTE